MDWTFEGRERRCTCCGEKGHIFCRVKESYDGGHEDYQFWCKRCNGKWWVDGTDA